MKTIGIVLLVIGMGILFKYVAGFSLLQLASDLGMKVETMALIKSFGFAVVIAIVLMVAVSLLGQSTKKITVTDDSMKVDSRIIRFDNVARVIFDDSRMTDKILKKGTVDFELTGTDTRKIEVGYVDNPKTVTERIQFYLNNYRMRRYAQFADQQRIQRIVQEI
jgi:hypothetical protein